MPFLLYVLLERCLTGASLSATDPLICHAWNEEEHEMNRNFMWVNNRIKKNLISLPQGNANEILFCIGLC